MQLFTGLFADHYTSTWRRPFDITTEQSTDNFLILFTGSHLVPQTQYFTFTQLYVLAFWDYILCIPTCIIALLATTLNVWILLGLFFDPEDTFDLFLWNVGWRFNFDGLIGVISQKIELFIITAVRTQILHRRIKFILASCIHRNYQSISYDLQSREISWWRF
jgi:hypothetical protein